MTPEKMFKEMYGREPNDIELMQFKKFYRYKNVEKKLYGAAKRAKENAGQAGGKNKKALQNK